MADLKAMAGMQIGGPRYPKKRRINLYQKKVKKEKVAAELAAFAVFMAALFGFSQTCVIRPLKELDRAETLYARTEQELKELKRITEVYDEVTAEYAHYGNGYKNEEEKKRPDRLVMLNCLKTQIFPLAEVSAVSITSDQMSLTATLPNGTLYPRLVLGAEEDPDTRYVTASMGATMEEEGKLKARASEKNVTVTMIVFFNEPQEDEEDR